MRQNPSTKQRRITFTVILLIGLLISAIILNAAYLTFMTNKNALSRAHMDLYTKFNIAKSIHDNQIEKLKILSTIVKDQNQKFCDFLDYDNQDAIGYMLKALVTIHDFEFILIYNEDGALLNLYPKAKGTENSELYKNILGKKEAGVTIVPISTQIIEYQFPHIKEGAETSRVLCFKSVIQLIHDTGEIYGYVVLIKFVNGNQTLIDQMTRISEVEVTYYDEDQKPVLTSFSNKDHPFPQKGHLSVHSIPYLTKVESLKGSDQATIGYLGVAFDKRFYLKKRQQQILNNILPFIVSVCISIILFYVLKKRVFNKIHILSNALRSVIESEADYSIRVPVGNNLSNEKRLDEVELMCADFNQMMDKLETTYTQMIKVREAVEIANQELEERVKKRTAQLSKMYFELKSEIEERQKTEEDRVRLEKQLHRAQKMEAIGTLAGGVAHDLNNILSGIVSFPELVLMNLPEDSPLVKPILTIKKSGEKAAAVVQDLLTLSRRGVFDPKVLNLNKIIKEYMDSLEFHKVISEYPNVKVETYLSKKLFNISGSPIHLSKTIMNLVLNAVESMTHWGILTISTENIYVDRPIPGYDDVKEGDYIRLRVSDTGTGISEENIQRIFEPFFTKKQMGRSGTGLGMTVVWGTVKDHKGYIDIKSTLGKGTQFNLFFPVTRKVIPREVESTKLNQCKGNGEHILIVDDVKEQREIVSQMLKQLGYRITCVPSGEKAIRYVKKIAVDLIILDMIMDPGIDGYTTYKKIIQIRPGQKAIITSGFAESDRVKKTQQLGVKKYIKKPYTLYEIGNAIKEAFQ